MSRTDSSSARRRIVALAGELEVRAIAHALRPLLQTEITIQQLKVLTIVTAVPGGASVSRIAAELRVSIATSSGLVQRLVDQKLVVRSEDADDARSRRVQLTALGEAALRRLTGARPEFGVEVVARLSDEDTVVVERALTAILDAFPSVAAAGDGVDTGEG